MICAYDKLYLDKARTALGRMLDFAVYDLNYNLTEFYNLFLSSGVAERFGCGDFTLLVGKSGVELAYEVLEQSGIDYERVKVNYTANRSEEYWSGWALAYYQWKTALSFREIEEFASIKSICEMYDCYHEMDIQHFVDRMNERYHIARPYTNLKRMRQRAGFSQSKLAEVSGVPMRTIQQYEQRQKNINKAQVEYLLMLAQALCCRVEDLVEKVELAR